MINQNKYFLSALASYIIWGFLPLFFKQVSEYNNVEIIFYRVLFAAVFLSLILSFRFSRTSSIISASYQKSKKDFFIMLTLTASGALLLTINWVSFVYTVNHISISTAAFGYMVLPINSALLSFLILREKLNLASWIAIGLSGISCYILGNVSPKDIIFVFIIAFSYAFYLITQRKNTLLPRHINLAIQLTLCTLFLLCIKPFQHVPLEIPFHFWFYIAIIALFFTVTPLFLNLFALNGMKTAQLSYLAYINPIISFLIGIFLYNEKPSQLAFLAYCLLAIAVIILNWNWIKKLLHTIN